MVSMTSSWSIFERKC